MAVAKSELLRVLKVVRQNNDTRYNVTVEKQSSAESGYAATYVVKENGVQKGEKINIPKDYLVKAAEVKTVTTADTPITGYTVGQKYIDFTVNTVGGDGNASHLYILVDELMQPLKSGNGIIVGDDNTISVSVDSSNANGLSAGAGGVALATVTASTSGVGGSNGAMTAADKEKLDGIDTGANAYTHPSYTATTGAETADATPAFGGTVSVSQVTSDSTGHVTGQTTRTITIPNATVVAATSGVGGSNGLMTAADKEILDNLQSNSNETVTDGEIAAIFVD
jgi:hypothetical protein